MEEPEDVVCRRVLLIRHGHYERTGGLGDTVWGLSPLGRRQAIKAGRRLARIVQSASERLDGVYASPWPRATQTAQVAAREMALHSVRIKPYLHEIVPLVADEQQKKPSPFGLKATSPEDRDAAHRQIDRVHGRFFKAPRRKSIVVIFTHGNLVRYLVARTLGLPYESWTSMDIAHCGITELRVYPNGFEALIRFNETGHLPPPMITTS